MGGTTGLEGVKDCFFFEMVSIKKKKKKNIIIADNIFFLFFICFK